jgi:hypothetical protein
MVLAHILLASFSRFKCPPFDLLQSVLDRAAFTSFVSEIPLLNDFNFLNARTALGNICAALIAILDQVRIVVTFSCLVYRTVVESYSAEWIWEQHIDDVEYLMELIVFARDIVPGVSRLSLLLGLIQSSTSLLPVLVVTEVISETKFDSGFRLGPLVRIFR